MQINITDSNGKTQANIDLAMDDGIIISAGSAELAVSIVRTPNGLKIIGPFNVNNRTVEVDEGGIYVLLPSKGNRRKLDEK